MKEFSNINKIETIFKKNKGYITREDIDRNNIPSWFLSDFVKKNNLTKFAPGFYADESYIVDEYYLLQKRYPKFIFSGMSSLFLHSLTDKVVEDMEVVAPQGYNPSREKKNNLSIRRISDKNSYFLGIEEKKTMYGNIVKTYDPERTICDLIKYRDKYDIEVFIKAIKKYVKKYNNQTKLMRYAKALNVEKKVFEIMEVIVNED